MLLKKYKKLLSLCFLSAILISSLSAFAQVTPTDALKKLYDVYAQEKIYLWTNKPEYVVGETIWFKAYVFTGYEVSLLSTSLYVELYDADKKLIGTKLLPIISGVSEGSIDLDGKLNEGVYFVRAYTRWMLNFNEAFQYFQPVLVYNPASTKKLKLNNPSWKAVAVPEGGSLIDGLETKVAVRRISSFLLDNKWGGYIYEENNPAVKLNEFASLDENAALFTFTPEAGKKYQVLVKDEKENSITCSLPVVQSSGVGFSVEKANDSLICKFSFQNIPGNGNRYSLTGEIQDQLLTYAAFKKTSTVLYMKIAEDSLQNGVLHLTLFDPANKPVAERLVFVNHSKLNFDSSVLLEHSLSAQPRSKNELQLLVDSVNWISYAVSVNDGDAPSPLEKENILSSIWLTSDFTNPIQKPATYFNHPDKNKIEALDALLIAEKWTRFNWNEVLNNKFPVINYIPHNYLSYSGSVKNGKKLKPNEELNLILYYPDSSSLLMQAQSDNAGNITLNNLGFTGELKVFYQLNSKKYAARLIDINFERNNRFVPYSLPLPETPYSIAAPSASTKNPAWVDRATNSIKLEKEIENKFKTLQEVIIQSKLKSAKLQLNEKLSSGLFHSFNEVIFDFVNETQNAIGYTNILEWLQGRVAGLSLQLVNSDYVPYMRGSPSSLYIDEMPADPGLIGSISISDIAMIKVIKGLSVISGSGGGGIIAIYTARGNLRPMQKEPSLPNNKLKGYDLVKKYFLPNYTDKSTPLPNTDTRDQLLWQTILPPSVSADKLTLSFYNNDNAKRFRVIVQGFTAKGFPVYLDKIVEPPAKAF